MKKHLLGTSAIVAASLGMATAAYAQNPPVTSNVRNGINLTVTGFVGSIVGFASQDDVGPSSYGTNPNNSTCTNCSRIQTTDMHSDVRVEFRGAVNLDDGLRAGFVVQIPGTQAGSLNYSHIAENSLFLESGWGRISGGNQGAAHSQIVGSTYSTGNPFSFGVANDVFARVGMVSGGRMHTFLVNPTGSSGTDSMINGENGAMNSGNVTKVSYTSPRIFGLQAGVSYIPELSRDYVGTGEVVKKDGQAATYRNGISAGINYVGNFAGVDVAAGFGYMRYLDQPDKSGIAGTFSINDGSAGMSMPDPELFQAGLQVHYAGFKIGGGWGQMKNARNIATSLTEFTGSSSMRISTLNSSLVNQNGEAWSVGGSYAFGPAAISVNYTQAKNDDCPVADLGGTLTCSGVDRFSGIGVSGVYTLGPGVTANLGGFYGRYRGNNYNAGSVVDAALTATATGKTNAAQNNDGGGVLGGILIRF